MIYLTRVEHFNAAHKLYNPCWDREKNEEIFGKCANENWHGHNYELYITIKGEINNDTGFLFDAKKLSILIKEHVLDKLDHKNLNVEVGFLKGQICPLKTLQKVSGSSCRFNYRKMFNCIVLNCMRLKEFM